METGSVLAGAMLLAAALVLAAARGDTQLTLVAVGVAAFTCVVAVLGPGRTGVLLLMGAFFTAPYYKGAAPSPGSPVTATDVLLLLGFALLLPRVLEGRLRLPIVYWVGAMLVLAAGLISSAGSTSPRESYVALMFWMIVMVGLPIAFALWGPSLIVIDLLAGSFVLGQMFSFALGWARGNVADGRHAGLATHPNYFAEGGMLALALLIYLAYRHLGKSLLRSAAIIGALCVCALTVHLSGSRAALVVVVVLILIIPIVERSAFTGFVMAALAALAVSALPIIADLAGKGSAIDRLAGGGGASQSNSARTLGLDEGLDRFFAHPIRGDGLIELFDIHNNFLEVAVATGVFGLAGYVMVLYAFARPILGTGELRRLCYPVLAYIGFGATVPSLYDRSIWAVVALSAVAMVEFERRRTAGEPRSTTLPEPATARSLSVRTRPGASP
jgi:O-antigen ligase